MHSVLLIDEVLEAILERCSDWDRKEYKWTLCQIARSCKAWKDPALDRLWKKLDCLEPLLPLLSEVEEDGIPHCEETKTVRLHSYIDRVKHISLSSAMLDVSSSPVVFPNLRSASLFRSGCLTSATWLASPKLSEIRAVLGAIAGKDEADQRCSHLATILRHHAKATSVEGLQKLHIRGWTTPVLNDAITLLGSLRSLTLHTGRSLTTQALASITSFPLLEQLSVHAGHIDTTEFISALYPTSRLPSLRSLRIRGQRSLFCAILDIIPQNTLHTLYLETEDYDQTSHAWNTTFNLIAHKAADTLKNFTLDQLLEPEELGNSIFLFGIDTRLALDTLQPLSSLHSLRRLTVDAMILPDFTDRDIEQLAAWWPHLEHLDLGSLPGVLDHIEAWTPRVTLASLHQLAQRCPSLVSLTIPLDICNATAASVHAAEKGEGKVVQQTALRRLYVGPPPADANTIPLFVRNVLDIFPRVTDIECTSVDKSLCVDIPTNLKDAGAVEEDAHDHEGTLDGYADGQ